MNHYGSYNIDTLYYPKVYIEEYDLYKNIEGSPTYCLNSHFGLNTGLIFFGQFMFEFSSTVELIEVTDNGLIWLSNEEIETPKITIYPNPTENYLFINGLDKEFLFSIYNSEGKLVQKGKTIDKVDVSELESGLYTIKLLKENQTINTRFIKQ